MTIEPENQDLLEAHFKTLQEKHPSPSADLVSRVLADAHDVQAAQLATKHAQGTALPSKRFSGILASFGGWPAMAGFAAATVAGVWIGINPPETIALTAQSILTDTDAFYAVDFDPTNVFVNIGGAL